MHDVEECLTRKGVLLPLAPIPPPTPFILEDGWQPLTQVCPCLPVSRQRFR